MQYLTGVLALQVPCKCDGIGLWNLQKKDFLDESLWDIRESSESKFGKHGIEENKIVPYHNDEIYNVADYVRVYLDMLADCKFKQLKGLFVEALNTSDCRYAIFSAAYRTLNGDPIWKKVNKFLTKEFGNAWLSYRSDAEQASEIAKNAVESYRKWESTRKDREDGDEDNED